MTTRLVNLTFEVELQAGEKFALPEELEHLGVGRWIITVQPVVSTTPVISLTHNHDAFLDSYAPEDEGLYDDDPPGFTPTPVTASIYDAFLDSYAPEDEGLYDNLVGQLRPETQVAISKGIYDAFLDSYAPEDEGLYDSSFSSERQAK